MCLLRGLQGDFMFSCNSYNPDSHELQLDLGISSGIRLILLLIFQKLFQWAEWHIFCSFSSSVYLFHIHEQKGKKEKNHMISLEFINSYLGNVTDENW